MAYLIGQDEPAGKGVRRVLREQNARITSFLSHWEADPADSIHCARQACKRARAVAQLLKAATPYAAGVENSFFRDIQKRVAYARDAEARVEALDYLKTGVREPRLAESVAMLRDSLAVRAVQDIEENRTQLRTQIELACRELRDADRRLVRLPLADLRRRDLQRGADHTWERCIAGFASLQPGSAASGYHAWRRQVKYAAHQTQLLANLAPTRAITVGPRLRELSALLGHGQDLELLETLLRQQPDALRIDTHVERLRQLIAATLAQLRCRALEVGAELFGDASELLGDSTEGLVTEAKHSRKCAAINPEQASASAPRHVVPDRDPHPSRRRQSR